jgi:hypothetical protein
MFIWEFLLFFTKMKKIYPQNIDLSLILGYNKNVRFFLFTRKGDNVLDIRPGDVLTMKKNHPCGGSEMFVIRAGMDFRLRCIKCAREFMVARNKIEKSIRSVKHADEG